MKSPQVACIVLDSVGRLKYFDMVRGCIAKQTYKNCREYASHLPQSTVGDARNIAIGRSDGSIIAMFDDDDWSAPTRIERSVAAIKDGASLVGTSMIYYVDKAAKKAWLYDGRKFENPAFIPGGTWVMRRSLWSLFGGYDIFKEFGEDGDFLRRVRNSPMKIVDLEDPTLYVASIHDGNTCRKVTTDRQWSPVDYEGVMQIRDGK